MNNIISKIELPNNETYNLKDDNALSKSGGEMQKDAVISYPVGNSQGGVTWNGKAGNVKLFTETASNGSLNLIVQFTNDNNDGFIIRNSEGEDIAKVKPDGEFTGTIDWQKIINKPGIGDLEGNGVLTMNSNISNNTVTVGTLSGQDIGEIITIPLSTAIQDNSSEINYVRGQISSLTYADLNKKAKIETAVSDDGMLNITVTPE